MSVSACIGYIFLKKYLNKLIICYYRRGVDLHFNLYFNSWTCKCILWFYKYLYRSVNYLYLLYYKSRIHFKSFNIFVFWVNTYNFIFYFVSNTINLVMNKDGETVTLLIKILKKTKIWNTRILDIIENFEILLKVKTFDYV